MRTGHRTWLSPPLDRDSRRAWLLGGTLGLDNASRLTEEQKPVQAVFVTLALVAMCFVAMLAATG